MPPILAPPLEEVLEALTYEGLGDKLNEIETFYNGYSAGLTSTLFNPWSMLNYLNDKLLQPFWVETGRTEYIEQLLLNATEEIHKKMQQLLLQGQAAVPMIQDINYKTLAQTPDQIWSLLYFSGYITGRRTNPASTEVIARVPNKEVEMALQGIYASHLSSKYPSFIEGARALLA